MTQVDHFSTPASVKYTNSSACHRVAAGSIVQSVSLIAARKSRTVVDGAHAGCLCAARRRLRATRFAMYAATRRERTSGRLRNRARHVDRWPALLVPGPGLVVDSVPSDVGTELFAGDGAFGGALEIRAARLRNASVAADPPAHVWGMGSNQSAQCGLPAAVAGDVLIQGHTSNFSASLKLAQAFREFHLLACRYPIELMATIDEIRRANLALLVEQFGSLRALAEQCNKSESQMSQWLHGSADSKTGRRRGMRSESCRHIEIKCGLPDGWLDQPHQQAALRVIAGGSPSDPADVEIHHFDTGGAMGGGVILQDQPGVIQSWRVTQEWVQKNVKHYSALGNLCIVTGFGDSMRPMFNPGDPLLVDRGVHTVEFDAVYFFRVGNDGFVKRLQRIPGEGIRVISANRENYDAWTIKKGMDFEVFGRVLKVWCSEDF